MLSVLVEKRESITVFRSVLSLLQSPPDRVSPQLNAGGSSLRPQAIGGEACVIGCQREPSFSVLEIIYVSSTSNLALTRISSQVSALLHNPTLHYVHYTACAILNALDHIIRPFATPHDAPQHNIPIHQLQFPLSALSFTTLHHDLLY